MKLPRELINKLTALNLGHNKLDSKSCKAIAHLIPHVPDLKRFCYSYTDRIVEIGTVQLIRSLKALKFLEKLELHISNISVEDCKALSELLSSSTSLNFLDITSLNDALPSEAVGPIITELCHNTGLETLVMSFPHFSLDNTKSLAEVLRANHTLIHLKLERCTIDSDGACELASALHTNSTLQTLDLAKNPIGVKGATAFAEMLLENKSLKELDLMDKSIDKEGTQKLIDCLTRNTTVRKLYLPVRYEQFIMDSKDSSRVEFVKKRCLFEGFV